MSQGVEPMKTSGERVPDKHVEVAIGTIMGDDVRGMVETST